MPTFDTDAGMYLQGPGTRNPVYFQFICRDPPSRVSGFHIESEARVFNGSERSNIFVNAKAATAMFPSGVDHLRQVAYKPYVRVIMYFLQKGPQLNTTKRQ